MATLDDRRATSTRPPARNLDPSDGGGEDPIDTIVIGGGHNGLTCAAYLARAGKRVVVLESLPTAGGYCTSEATVPEAPGFLMNTGGIDHIFTNIGPSVVDELRLDRHGLRYVDSTRWPATWARWANACPCGATSTGRAPRSRASPDVTRGGTGSS